MNPSPVETLLNIIRPLVLSRWRRRETLIQDQNPDHISGYTAGYWDGVNDAAEVEAELENLTLASFS